jgi:hypothetical protein
MALAIAVPEYDEVKSSYDIRIFPRQGVPRTAGGRNSGPIKKCIPEHDED